MNVTRQPTHDEIEGRSLARGEGLTWMTMSSVGPGGGRRRGEPVWDELSWWALNLLYGQVFPLDPQWLTARR